MMKFAFSLVFAMALSLVGFGQSDYTKGEAFIGFSHGQVGVDIKLNDRFDLRAFQLDYNPVNLETDMIHNLRLGVGIVIK
ncbi:MAG: hypothetical protein ABR530_06310 [Pyrinomonadaceae bacterium]